jgi:hypothetical protein
VLTGVTQLYALVSPDDRIGPGIGWELAFVRSKSTPVTIRALKALRIDNELGISVGPALARIIFERPELSLVHSTGTASARREFQSHISYRGDYSNEEEITA